MRTPSYSLIALVGALAACATAPQHTVALDQARTAVRSAQTDPQVAQNAPVELKRAEDTLREAERLANESVTTSTVDHYAYLASQRAAIARESAALKMAEAQVQTASREREQVQLEARTREADTAKQVAQAAQQQAQTAQQQAQAQALEAQSARQQAMSAQERASRLEQQLSTLQAQHTDRGITMTLGDVLFETGSANLKSGAQRRLQQLAGLLKENPERVVLIEGFTDSVGNESYNQQLSERRAQAVRQALASQGVEASRVQVRGYGEAYPVASNASAAGRQQNRRVEVVISETSGQIPERGAAGRPGR